MFIGIFQTNKLAPLFGSSYCVMNRLLAAWPAIRIVCPISPCLMTSRAASGKWRADRGLPPRHASPGPLADLPDWSYLDGRGPGPLNIGQKKRYLRDIRFTQEVIKYIGQAKTARELVPDEIVDKNGRRKKDF